jgi:hypothetical protein
MEQVLITGLNTRVWWPVVTSLHILNSGFEAALAPRITDLDLQLNVAPEFVRVEKLNSVCRDND